MKASASALVCVVTLATLLHAAFASADPVYRRNGRLKQKKGSKCKYYRKAKMGTCDLDTMTRSVTFDLKKGVNCPPTEVFRQACDPSQTAVRKVKGCKYDRKAQWSDCSSGELTKRKVMMLKSGQAPSCPPTRTKTMPCRKSKSKSKSRPGKLRKKGRRKGRGKECKYIKGSWTDCDTVTNTRTRQLTLKKGDKSLCLPSKTITKKCKKPCKYNKGPWLPCNAATNLKARHLTLKKGDPSICNASMVLEKPCRRRDAFTAAKTSQCKYKPLDWGECDTRTNTMTRELKLKSGDPALCQQTKHLTRKCRKPCKFSKGEWSECDETTNLRTRTDRLSKGSPAQCEEARVISRKCSKDIDCKYDVGDWGECEPGTQQRSRVKTLVDGDPDKCQAQITISRPCLKPNGEESCFLGTWTDYGPCQNGVMMKHRKVIAGGVQCERKAVKTKPCS